MHQLTKGLNMNILTLIVLGIIEQIIVFTVILPTTGWWFSIFGLTAAWSIITLPFNNKEQVTDKQHKIEK